MIWNGQVPEIPDQHLYEENQRKLTWEQIAPYVGRHVAWSLDGARILASGRDWADLEANVAAAAIDPRHVVFGFIDPPEVPLV